MAEQINTIELISSERGGVTITGIPDNGSYIVLVSDQNPEGASAIFMVTAAKNKGGRVFRASNSEGSSSEQLTILWYAGISPVLTYATPPKDEGNRTFKLKVIGIDDL